MWCSEMNNWHPQIQQWLETGNLEQVISFYQDEITSSPEEITNYYYLGLAYLTVGDGENAQLSWMPIFLDDNDWSRKIEDFLPILDIEGAKQIQKRNFDLALRIYTQIEEILLGEEEMKSSWGIFYYHFALTQEGLGDINKAIKYYQESILMNPELVDSYYNLGNIYQGENRLEDALLIYRQAQETNPRHYGSYLNIGNIFFKQGNYEDAIKVYQQGLEKELNEDLFYNLALVYQKQGNSSLATLNFAHSAYHGKKYQDAIELYQEYLKNNRESQKVYLSLGECYENAGLPEDVVRIYQEAIKIYPDNILFYQRLIFFVQHLFDGQTAINLVEKFLLQQPNNLALKMESQKILPRVYESTEEIAYYRERFTRLLDSFIAQTDFNSSQQMKEAHDSVIFRSNFYLQYQQKDDLELQCKYGDYMSRVMAYHYPQFSQLLSLKKTECDHKIKVGYASARLCFHTVAKLFFGWLKNHDKSRFEIYAYHLGHDIDQVTNNFKIHSDVFRNLTGSVEEICQIIKEDELDILVFLDIGMYPQTASIASLRLAPIQCMTWGHPVTSGLPTIDYFLSSELMETKDAQKFYREKLITLPKISICFSKPSFPPTPESREDVGLSSESVIYLCCQSLFKYLPNYDYLFPRIAQQVSNAKFVFINNSSQKVTAIFQTRLKEIFTKFNLNYEDFVTFLPRTKTHHQYLSINLFSDIYLDSLGWSGGCTTLEAIACNLPVVTCPGKFMRGRHSYAILKMLGVTETIANTEEEYIDIAVKLGLDQTWREEIKEKIKANHHNLYDDLECVKALEQFYIDVCKSSL
ncbi:tetratricopeptide repeat protein [Cyanobacterium aponinum]|uniref:O-linked N-acetylglucosamine transferase family protein n=1 Tax=Cyanobacterium aponinum TaxID=379064 RepID=UPI000C12B025|nr:tetratricopeptide repeat protein [Cyanobacterium aponinum]PHV62814.1 glycosyl transferase family 1 [Cyanobacterium aponinum IPPAS B-1201]